MRKLVHTALIFLALTGCKTSSGKPGSKKDTSKVIASVGKLNITEDMVELRSQMLIDEPSIKDPRIMATAQLMHGILSANIAAAFGRPISESTVKQYWDDARHSIPEKLAELEKKTENKVFFLVVMVLPNFASMTVQNIYYETDEPHAKTIEYTQKIFAKVINHPENFQSVATHEQLPFDQLWISSDDLQSESEQHFKAGKVANSHEYKGPLKLNEEPESPGFSVEEREAASELYKQLGSTKTGKVHPRPIQTPDAFQLLKIEKREKNRAKISLITINKRDIEDWFWEFASDLAVEFTDPKFGEQFLKEVPWGKKLMVRRSLYPTVFPENPQPEDLGPRAPTSHLP